MNMKFFQLCMAASFLLTSSSCMNTPNYECGEINIIPLPNTIQQGNGVFELKDGMIIGFSDVSIEPAADYLASILSKSTGYQFMVREGAGAIQLKLAANDSDKKGSYLLDVSSSYAQISASSYSGIISGIETFRQLLPSEIEFSTAIKSQNWFVPEVKIEDSPRFEWRGLMLDVSRHFYSPDEIKEMLDLMALYKLNKFHWHLTDDQGWRIEIKKYPLLTERGAWRTFNSQDRECIRRAKAENNSDFDIPDDKLQIVQGDTLYGGFYTQEDIKDIVQYAEVLGIDVIPEVDMPGHMLAAISNYSGVSCFSKTGWGKTFSSPVCPGKESALQFCKNVYDEIIPLFPYKYIHLIT